MIAEETLSLLNTQAKASCDIERSSPSAIGFNFCTAVKISSDIKREIKFAPLFLSVAREPAGGFLPGRYFPVSTP
jgi:hypothetical protein